MESIFFIDTEVSEADNKVCDYGAVNEKNDKLHTHMSAVFSEFISYAEFICGHNIIDHDLKYIDIPDKFIFIDTLYLSPLMFPNKPYHALLKDDKLQSDELNNPLNDALKAMELFYDEVNAFNELDNNLKNIYYTLLHESPYFSGFFRYMGFSEKCGADKTIASYFSGRICESVNLSDLILSNPVELAYCLAFISADEKHSLIPQWVRRNYPEVDNVIRLLRNTSCGICEYCKEHLNPVKYLRKYFGYSSFRKYNDEPLQEKAVSTAVAHKSLLAIFPTGGGKSLTFQLPALMSGETEKGLTVVISPLQSLMKDQVDNLEKKGIADAVTINGLLSPIERAEAIERVENGIASILYISPESLRSVTIERLFLSRKITRFVIDEAHCFSAWGQDFRVDYLYIGDFIRELQEKKGNYCHIPVSCFTATAKQKVISDIRDYFNKKLGLQLELFATNATRTNLHYNVIYREDDTEKYDTLRMLIEQKNCPAIVYVSRKKRTRQLTEKLINDGFRARAFHGKMESIEKQANQEAFINDEVQIIVATSAFGMGVDKSNVGLVVHYDISDSLENYVQEAGRAGRDQSLQAECYVLFNNDDLDKHFILLNQTKLSMNEIQQVWKAVKTLTKTRPEICCSALEIARQAGWDDSVSDIETRVRTAVQALENAGYIKRGKNVPRIYATSILVKNMMEAVEKIENSHRFTNDTEKQTARRIIKSLISSKSISNADNSDAESRIDYLADRLGVKKEEILNAVQHMRGEGILSDTKDLTAYIMKTDKINKSVGILNKFKELEKFLLENSDKDKFFINYKELNDSALTNGIRSSTVNAIKTIFYYWTIKEYVKKEQDEETKKVTVELKISPENLTEKRMKSYKTAEFILHYLFNHDNCQENESEEVLVSFSELELKRAYNSQFNADISEDDIEEALLFLSKTGALKLDGGFLVVYNGMRLKRLVLDNKIRYKVDDYRQLNEFYKHKIQQIHIIGEYANMMVRNYNEALNFVNDYFQMDYKKFLSHYFAGECAVQIERNITPEKYHQLFDTLSSRQLKIINDNSAKYIVVTAGPGSGKTKVLVHKLASLLLLEDVKHEQLLMLTFSRAAAIEFKQRLCELIGNAAHFIEIKTFHSYCFDLIGKIGNLQDSENIVRDAGELIQNGDVDLGRITKTVLVIDEAQDMDKNEFNLVRALMARNDDMRIIAVGDDDQNIYQFRGSDTKYFKSFITDYNAVQYSLIENYRSSRSIVDFANRFAGDISNRMKSEDIKSVSENTGEVRIIKHRSSNIEIPVVDDIISSAVTGTTCILTNTNQEALTVSGLLKQKKISSKLIQSNDGFDMYNISEIRFFIKKLEKDKALPVISDRQWYEAIELLKKTYSKSEFLPDLLDILDTFRQTNNILYRTDLLIFLHESKLEDFCKSKQGVITVSTMHKSKGREFDNVFMMLNNVPVDNDKDKRKIYVGITRAKKLLHIHYNGKPFDKYSVMSKCSENDCTSYPEPPELILPLSHKDVFLDYFKDKKQLILSRFYSGLHLSIRDNRLYFKSQNKSIPVLQFSSAGNEKIKKIISDGYYPYDAKIRFICAWKGKEDTDESAVILPDIYLKKSNR
ncbi:MAG: RecQ family ATP-dependent DNA helicase [Ruminococcus sp.]|nr:RecQ family ATP-dependent DNA helicase [Ruminococcus sp.]